MIYSLPFFSFNIIPQPKPDSLQKEQKCYFIAAEKNAKGNFIYYLQSIYFLKSQNSQNTANIIFSMSTFPSIDFYRLL